MPLETEVLPLARGQYTTPGTIHRERADTRSQLTIDQLGTTGGGARGADDRAVAVDANVTTVATRG